MAKENHKDTLARTLGPNPEARRQFCLLILLKSVVAMLSVVGRLLRFLHDLAVLWLRRILTTLMILRTTFSLLYHIETS